MAKNTKKTETAAPKAPVTRAEKTNATKNLIKELLAVKPYKHNELIDEVAKSYVSRFGEETDNINDVKGRVGSVLDIMKKESDVMYEGGMYALKARSMPEMPVEVVAAVAETVEKTEDKKEEKSAPKRVRAKAKKVTAEPEKEEKPAKKETKAKTAKTTKRTKTDAKKSEEVEKEADPLPIAPLQPIAPVAPVTPEAAPVENPAPKKRGRKAKASKELEGQTELDLHELETPVAVLQTEPSERLPEESEMKTGNEAPMVALTEETDAKKSEEDTIGKIDIQTETQIEIPTEMVIEEVLPEMQSDVVTEPIAEEKIEETVVEAQENQVTEEKKEESTATALQVKEKAEIAPKNVVMDMSFLFGDIKPARAPQATKQAMPNKTEKSVVTEKAVKTEKASQATEGTEQRVEKTASQAVGAADQAVNAANTEKKAVSKPQSAPTTKPEQSKTKPAPKTVPAPVVKAEENKEETPAPTTGTAATPVRAPRVAANADRENNRKAPNVINVRRRSMPERALTPDEKLRDAFLKRMRSLGGDYFEYYSVYLLERYSMKNGRRLEGMKITGGDHDGGIDGEIELTDKFGFKETIYIQSKNWDPDKGDEKLWIVGETLLQQFIGACACRQAKQGKQHCRGIFVTTSRFTPEAKRILDDLSDKLVGYDGADLYEAAKECQFGIVKKNGEWALDEQLLSGSKAFFNML